MFKTRRAAYIQALHKNTKCSTQEEQCTYRRCTRTPNVQDKKSSVHTGAAQEHQMFKTRRAAYIQALHKNTKCSRQEEQRTYRRCTRTPNVQDKKSSVHTGAAQEHQMFKTRRAVYIQVLHKNTKCSRQEEQRTYRRCTRTPNVQDKKSSVHTGAAQEHQMFKTRRAAYIQVLHKNTKCSRQEEQRTYRCCTRTPNVQDKKSNVHTGAAQEHQMFKTRRAAYIQVLHKNTKCSCKQIMFTTKSESKGLKK